jgi:hypothetical protein
VSGHHCGRQTNTVETKGLSRAGLWVMRRGLSFCGEPRLSPDLLAVSRQGAVDSNSPLLAAKHARAGTVSRVRIIASNACSKPT